MSSPSFNSRFFSLWLALSLALMPFANLPRAQAATVSPLQAQLSEMETLLIESEELQERALFPRIPRAISKAAPALADISKLQAKALQLREALHKHFLTDLLATKDEAEQKFRVKDINLYFEAIRRIE